jgi:hypothetical protein
VKGKAEPVNIYEVRGQLRKTAAIDTPKWDGDTGMMETTQKPNTEI